LQERHDWPGLNGVVIVDSIREIGRTIERETRLFITSLSLPAKSLAAIVRSHWAVESAPQAQERKVRDELTDRAQAA
jgi:hypothetical protein